jgi:hypothetical protein
MGTTTIVFELVSDGVQECRLGVSCKWDRPREATSWGTPAQPPTPTLPSTHSEELTSPMHACSFAHQQLLIKPITEERKRTRQRFEHRQPARTEHDERPTLVNAPRSPPTLTTTLRRAVGAMRLRRPTYPPFRSACSPDTNNPESRTQHAAPPSPPVPSFLHRTSSRSSCTATRESFTCVCGARFEQRL